MDTLEHESQYSVHLCKDTDEQPYIDFKRALTEELGAELIDQMWSPDISWLRFAVNKEILTVQQETYMGITLFGPQAIIDALMKRVQHQ